jgi:hypothetical protein
MGDSTTKIQNLSVAPRRSSGFISDGKFLKFGSPYPQSGTKLYGLEFALDLSELNSDPESQPREKRNGELALMYYYGRADDHFDESDLPLGDNPLADLIQFKAARTARSHILMSEWRWPLFAPAYSSKRLRLIQPQYGLGLGALYIRTEVSQDGPVEKVQKLAAFVTGSTQLRLMEVSLGPVDFSLEASVRIMAGQTYGIMGETALRVTYQR